MKAEGEKKQWKTRKCVLVIPLVSSAALITYNESNLRGTCEAAGSKLHTAYTFINYSQIQYSGITNNDLRYHCTLHSFVNNIKLGKIIMLTFAAMRPARENPSRTTGLAGN